MVVDDIGLEESFINIEDKYYGGSLEILVNNEDLRDFSVTESSGYFSVNDILLYELRKFSDTLGTFPKKLLSIEEYINLLRNHIDSKAYRFMGFISIVAMKNFFKRFSDKRKIKIETYIIRDIISKSLFINFIKEGLKNDHPIILQLRKRNPNKFPKFSVITGINENALTFSMDGVLREIKIEDVFDYQDLELGLLYINILNSD